jgi:flavoprotein
MITRNPLNAPVENVFTKENVQSVVKDLKKNAHTVGNFLKRMGNEVIDIFKFSKNINKIFDDGDVISSKSQLEEDQIIILRKEYEEKIKNENSNVQ